jgi:radical SAM enzyme (TIGR01210 family)
MPKSQASRSTPVAVWTERELLSGEKVNALVIILRSKGCSWSGRSGCLMCGYNNDCDPAVTSEYLVQQFEQAMSKYEDHPYLKIYTSGSFFDPDEVDIKARDSILGKAGELADRILVESRPEFVSKETLDAASNNVRSLEVAIGLETTDDDVRTRCVNKGFSYADFQSAVKVLKASGTRVRAYLLLKPPYLTEGKAIADVRNSIEKVSGSSDVISINPVNVQRGTEVERLWRRAQYRPPWLWSLLEVLKTPSRARLVSAPSGGGTRRGTHNCRKCDKTVLNALKDFNMNADPGIFDDVTCECKEEWLDTLELEPLAGTSGDLARLMRP